MRESYIGQVLLSLVVTSMVACGGDGTGDGAGGSADSLGLGSGGATAAGATTGGSASGGTASGGSASGGTATGSGAATNGGGTGATVATGGAAAGGAAAGGGGATGVGEAGGAATGGAGAGGQSTGGAATGGAGAVGEYPLGNPPVPSTGCGKTPSLSSGTHNMRSADLGREYILSIPDNYGSGTPHRLVFGMHWMDGSAEAVEGWSKWFGLKALDTESSTIFVAPQGYTDDRPWRGDDKDHTYFNELLGALTSDLCIDTSRVFSVGFSFGAMYTNSLAQNHQEVLRGVIVYATADYNIYFPENTGKPLAYMGVHGLNDRLTPIDSGRQSKDRFVENNGCTVPGTVPEARPGGDYVTYDYECPSNYPVRWITFDGAHTYPPNDTGTWVHGSTWEFITQF